MILSMKNTQSMSELLCVEPAGSGRSPCVSPDATVTGLTQPRGKTHAEPCEIEEAT